MSPAILLIINAISSLIKLRDDGTFRGLKADINNLTKKLTKELPRREDGKPWTDDDIHAAAADARTGFTNVLDRTGGPATEGDQG